MCLTSLETFCRVFAWCAIKVVYKLTNHTCVSKVNKILCMSIIYNIYFNKKSSKSDYRTFFLISL